VKEYCPSSSTGAHHANDRRGEAGKLEGQMDYEEKVDFLGGQALVR
jgi:hypothetical protein